MASGDKKPGRSNSNITTPTGDAILDFLQQQGPSQPTSTTGTTAVPKPLDKMVDALKPSEEEEELGDAELLLLLRELEEADGVATGLEDKLDGLLEDLDGILAGLEAAPPPKGPDKANPASS